MFLSLLLFLLLLQVQVRLDLDILSLSVGRLTTIAASQCLIFTVQLIAAS